jgi:deoxyribodipyrimidine photo-lyase
MNSQSINIYWFRRDLRFEDNHGLHQALSSGLPVLPLFIFDTDILNLLPDKQDARVHFIHRSLEHMHQSLKEFKSGMYIIYGKPENCFQELIAQFKIQSVFTNHDYEPYANERDENIKLLLSQKNIAFHTFKDQVIFEKDEVLKDDGKPYTVFTPYSRKWKLKLAENKIVTFPSESLKHQFLSYSAPDFPSLEKIGFKETNIAFPKMQVAKDIIRSYATLRDIPSIHGTSRLSVHLRFGTISIRQLALQAIPLSETYLNELIWRDFYHMILWHFPQVGKGKSFKPAYDKIAWRHDENDFKKWCDGETGYPIVDAGMRELNTTGFMHNRVRMIVASFLCKHLLIDWRWGESYFASKLLDFDFAANNGGWQWASGSGCDAAPYFRIFNPALQTKKFDAKGDYIRKWVPEFETLTYHPPMVVHEFARKRCLDVYSAALKGTND